MKLTIDNLDGLGPVDYSEAVDRTAPLRVERVLNTPSLAHGVLCLEGSELAEPVRRGRVVITADGGTVLFTGYLAAEATAAYAGVASEGPVYRLAFSAVSDEWLLDKQAAGSLVGVGLGDAGGTLLQRLVSRLDGGAIVASGLAGGRAVGVFVPESAATWSAHAGAVAGSTYGAYRVLNGALTLTPAGSVDHVLSDGDGTLSVAALHTSAVKELANDVTVTGGLEATVYWNELFQGDGTTVEFSLGAEPGAVGTGRKTLLSDDFTGQVFNQQRWAVSDPGSHLSLSGGGLTFTGGNGIDGQTTLTAWDQVEVAGTIVIELAGVALTGASAGVLGGLYLGTTMQQNCFAGFNVRQVGGATRLSPMVNGLETGTSMAVLDGHRYTLRLRLHCSEMQRVMQRYYAMIDGTVEAFGGGPVEAPANLVFEVRDLGASSNTPVTVLYDGAVAASVAQATFVAANSIQLFGTVNSVRVTRTGSAWLTSTSGTTGTSFTRLAGLANEGVDCVVTQGAAAKVTFLPGRVPDVNEIVQVSYRGSGRAVMRVADAASVAAEAAGGGVGTARWLGKVVRPAARSSADCLSAAQAVLAFSTDRAAATTGTYQMINAPTDGDVWPGDVLTLGGDGPQVIVRKVEIEDNGAAPEALTYRIAFANEWAEGLGIVLSEAIAEDAELPEVATDLATAGATVLPENLQGLTVRLGTGGTSLTIDSGVTPPAGWGFEVRRRDAAFGTGLSGSANGDLVLRSPVRGFSIPRAEFEETFYVRMYDGSVPANYSAQSVGIMTHLPIG